MERPSPYNPAVMAPLPPTPPPPYSTHASLSDITQRPSGNRPPAYNPVSLPSARSPTAPNVDAATPPAALRMLQREVAELKRKLQSQKSEMSRRSREVAAVTTRKLISEEVHGVVTRAIHDVLSSRQMQQAIRTRIQATANDEMLSARRSLQRLSATLKDQVTDTVNRAIVAKLPLALERKLGNSVEVRRIIERHLAEVRQEVRVTADSIIDALLQEEKHGKVSDALLADLRLKAAANHDELSKSVQNHRPWLIVLTLGVLTSLTLGLRSAL